MQQRSQLHPRLIMSSLWVSTLFIFAYVDIFALSRADILNDALAGQVAAFDVSQTFLALTTIYVIIPSLMVYLTLVVPRDMNRIINMVLPAIYIVTIAGSCIGETWAYYLIGSAVEIVLLSLIILRAWRLE